MRITVQGLWHLGSVTAACLASVGHDVIGYDDEVAVVNRLSNGKAPLLEPGLDDLLAYGLASGNLSFTTNKAMALPIAEVLWVAYDTPVDEDDCADVDFVMARVTASLSLLAPDAIVLISSQMPVGSVHELEKRAFDMGRPDIQFASCPENLRLGGALKVFLQPDRIVIGVRDDVTKAKLHAALVPITEKLEWMGVESAEMTKHAINAFLATSVTFANEIASICEMVGADAKEVERGLKTEMRIGPKAYLSPGGPFAGGTLARDIVYLGDVSRGSEVETPLLSSVKVSNDQHKSWVRRKILGLAKGSSNVSVAVWGLTYKPGTSTLRRSQSVELCDWLISQGATLHVHDPAVTELPPHWKGKVQRHDVAHTAAAEADILVIGTEWPEYQEELSNVSAAALASFVVIDANRFLSSQATALGVRYIAVGSQQM
ncbi:MULTISPECIES: nucleotide sugar dehydrogenase [unclassified Rhizobium]|uniref:nucleotide sugar dehydrogenase n=1 Tax=unclassified Rhizobium TaxID=2613769 RepID=UPI001160271D|nr:MULTISPECIES: nucleotide sugar dehydrogenase [unclassified Rhizobium]TQX86920.1 UDP-glucose/GDP-mannose dehydrogenase family protein [Rhizobium sp. rho-13.1]TQY05588.1 UDP-glucose/GDP-mannose dehydrogenase family protein [Rhizobium sp. rho-1.1]